MTMPATPPTPTTTPTTPGTPWYDDDDAVRLRQHRLTAVYLCLERYVSNPHARANLLAHTREAARLLMRDAYDAGHTMHRDPLAAASVADMVDEFHNRPGSDCVRPSAPSVDVPGALEHRVPFIEEEVRELREAVEAGDVVKTADALADLVYGVYGAAWRFGIPLDAVVAEVHQSNMTKTPAPGDAKAIKGPGYSPPDITAVLDGTYVDPEKEVA